ncbi:MAG: response regulator [Bacteroidetes bacterium]|nr:response regulator [Bacteroidota bacterium]
MNSEPELICVIEDNVSIRKLYEVILKKNDYTVVEFEEGNKAVEWLSTHNPLAVICDDLLPDSSGKEIITSLRNFSHGKVLPVIIVTGFAHATDRERYLAMGFDGYISKPINTSSFVEELRHFIDSKKK